MCTNTSSGTVLRSSKLHLEWKGPSSCEVQAIDKMTTSNSAGLGSLSLGVTACVELSVNLAEGSRCKCGLVLCANVYETLCHAL